MKHLQKTLKLLPSKYERKTSNPEHIHIPKLLRPKSTSFEGPSQGMPLGQTQYNNDKLHFQTEKKYTKYF